MYIERAITAKLVALAAKFPVVFVTGPRQAGKSTLLRHAFPGHAYVNLEEPDRRQFATEDPRGFLSRLGGPAIIDEAQRVPDLFSYLQSDVDARDEPGRFLLSGSQNFLMMRSIAQSLAGRVGVLTLFPLSLAELAPWPELTPVDADHWMLRGGYPRLHAGGISPEDYFPSYLATYVERDVRAEIGVRDVSRFVTFMRVLATRVGSPINLTDIGRQVAADARTISSWLEVLEECGIVFRLPPWHVNLGKRATKTPKLYFGDTGLLCSLLGVTAPAQLAGMRLRGAVFENAVIADVAKGHLNLGQSPPLYYWRSSDADQREIDLIVDLPEGLRLVEIKASQTANQRYTSTLARFEAPDHAVAGRQVVYDGPDGLTLAGVTFTNWRTPGWS